MSGEKMVQVLVTKQFVVTYSQEEIEQAPESYPGLEDVSLEERPLAMARLDSDMDDPGLFLSIAEEVSTDVGLRDRVCAYGGCTSCDHECWICEECRCCHEHHPLMNL